MKNVKDLNSRIRSSVLIIGFNSSVISIMSLLLGLYVLEIYNNTEFFILPEWVKVILFTAIIAFLSILSLIQQHTAENIAENNILIHCMLNASNLLVIVHFVFSFFISTVEDVVSSATYIMTIATLEIKAMIIFILTLFVYYIKQCISTKKMVKAIVQENDTDMKKVDDTIDIS